ncbi:peptidylprolyl isomerase [Sphaerisporangium sp. NPDC049002]|uniref:peptidylprolyl isomerase n=1 Tax=unclassified Sphaerisporangium TaxID=2630420 RepID=UPI0033DD64EF
MSVTATVAAEVGERVVLVSDVDAREAELRAGPLAARLPHPRGAEGRNLRRWLVQVLVTEALVEQEAAALGLTPADDRSGPNDPVDGRARPDVAVDGRARPDVVVGDRARSGPLALPAALRTGGVVAAVTVSMPLARALRAVVTAGVRASEDEVRAYYDRNLDRFTRPETRHVSKAGGASLGPVRRGELAGPLEAAIFSAREGEVVGPVEGPGGPWTVRVDAIEPGGPRPYEEVREIIASELTSVAVERAFASRLERRYAEKVRLRPGYEHPADPSHADATHRH